MAAKAGIKKNRASPTTVMADGTPISASPVWDRERGVLIVHSDRDAGSNYDHVLAGPGPSGCAQKGELEDAAALEALTAELDAAVGTR